MSNSRWMLVRKEFALHASEIIRRELDGVKVSIRKEWDEPNSGRTMALDLNRGRYGLIVIIAFGELEASTNAGQQANAAMTSMNPIARREIFDQLIDQFFRGDSPTAVGFYNKEFPEYCVMQVYGYPAWWGGQRKLVNEFHSLITDRGGYVELRNGQPVEFTET